MTKATKPDSSTEAIMRLINSFPCLRAKVRTAPTGFFDGGFDPDRFVRLFVGTESNLVSMSEQERQCVVFVLNVWNQTQAKCRGWHFDLMAFMAVAGPGERQAVARWISEPTWIERL